jgi:glutamine amidotransferase
VSATRVTIVDYGVGNVLSVRRALEHCGAEVVLASDASTVERAERLVLPGVGAFGDCARELAKRGLNEAVISVARADRPFLGICVGMQILADEGEEFGRHAGLGLVPGVVRGIDATGVDGRPHKVPHVGWSRLRAASRWSGTIFDALDESTGADVYFVHSFHLVPVDPAHRLAFAAYDGREITAAVARGRIFGTQFHPEKSGEAGLRVLRSFLALPLG